MRLLFFLLFIGLQAMSQTFDLGDVDDYENSSLDTVTNSMTLFYKDYYQSIDLETFSTKTIDLEYNQDLNSDANLLSFPHFHKNNKHYFVQTQGGLVYVIDKDTVKRIDRSFDHQMQYGADIFSHNNRIYKYGGYGFWSNRDFFTYYDENASEWEILQPINSKEIPQGLSDRKSGKNGENIFIFGGRKLDDHNRRKTYLNDELWSFNFVSLKWNLLGNYEPLSKQYKTPITYDGKLILLDNNKITLIDVLNNKKTVFEHSALTAKIATLKNIHYHDGKFYLILIDGTKKTLTILDEKEFFGRQISEGKFYKNHKYWISLSFAYILASIIVILVIWLGSKGYKKSRKIILLDNGLRYKNKFTEFDEESMMILRLMLKEVQVPSYQILQIVEKDQYSPAHNERLKVQKINEINLKISTLIGINEDVIQNFKSDEDRRIRVYIITRKFFN